MRLVDCEASDADVDPSLRYLRARFPGVDAWQVHNPRKKDYQTPVGIRVAPATALLRERV